MALMKLNPKSECGDDRTSIGGQLSIPAE